MDALVEKSIAIIPARGGSRRVPRKNLVDLGGRPLISWTIQAALDSRLFTRVVVSTDDEEIAAVSKAFGAEAPFLRDSFFDDHSTTSQATVRALNQAQAYYGERYEVVAQLMPNCPLRDSVDTQVAMDDFVLHDERPQISCASFGWVNAWWASTLDDSGTPSPLFPEASKKRSQDLARLVFPSGAIWIAKTSDLLSHGTFYTPSHRYSFLEFTHAIDIDEEPDLELARLVQRGQQR